MNAVKVFKKGDVLFKEGDKVTSIMLVQAGSVWMQFLRGKQKIDYHNILPHMIIGEYALNGQLTHPATGTAHAETKVIEVPVDGLKAQLDGSPQLTKAVLKGLLDKLKATSADLKSARLERDLSPCPPEQTAKVFGCIWHVASSKGVKNPDRVVVPWPHMKMYAQRIFLESPKRLEQAISIFVKLKSAEFQMVKNEEEPDQPDEIGFVHFLDLAMVEQFFEYYQYYHFKPGKQDLLKTDDNMMTLVAGLNTLAAGQTPDRQGLVRLDYQKVVEHMANTYGMSLKGDHFSMLELKGLFCKRQSSDQGVSVQFEAKEFERVFRIWLVLREVNLWNEKGAINMTDHWKPHKKVVHQGPACPACEGPINADHKFCPACGHKLQAAA